MEETLRMSFDGLRRRPRSGRASLPPGSRLPALAQVLWYAARPTEFLEHHARTYGDVFTIQNPTLGAEVVVTRPDDIKAVFTGDPETFRAGEANVILRPVVGSTSVLLLDGAAHMRKRRLLLPAFHGARMNPYTEIMVEEASSALEAWRRGETIAFRPIAQRITVAIILRAVFGTDNAEEQREIGDALCGWTNLGRSRVAAFCNMTPALQRDFPGSPWRAFTRARAKADALLYALIARRRAEAKRGAERTDVLSLLLAARDEQGEPMTDAELRDELVTLLMAGHETTAVTLCWLVEELLSRPGVVAELRDEIRSVTGGAPLAAADVPKLRLVDSAIKEAMRLHPVVPAVGRRLKAEARIGGYDLPAGVLLVPAIHLTHRLPDLSPDPLVFKLDRFVDKKIDPYAWLPFGGGVRRCLGMAFALQELKVVTAAVLSKHRLRLARRPDIRPRTVLRSVTLSPDGDTRVVVE